MTAYATGTQILPPGPTEQFDLHITPPSFDHIGALVKQYGDICRIKGLKRKSDSYLINHPDYIKHVLLANYDNYIKGVGFERVKLLLGNGIIVSDGAFWRSQRRMIQPAFSKANIQRLSQNMQQSNLQLLEQWQAKAGTGEKVNLSQAVSDLSLQIILHAIFSNDLANMNDADGKSPFAFFAQDTTRDLKVALKFRALTKLVAELIKERRKKNRQENDLLSALMSAVDKETKQKMADNHIIDEVMTLIVAGHETSAGTLNWAWYLLSKHPEKAAALHKELDGCLQSRIPDFDDIPNLSYTRQVIEETLRLYPPVWLFTRKAIKADNIGDYYAAPGTDIFISPYFLHRNEHYWHDPENFLPERFSEAASKKQHRFAFIPFSAGPRRCIGDIFGIVEMQIHLGIMAQRFVLTPVSDQAIELEPAVNLRSKHSIYMTIEPRFRS
jgi:cytochrome P450